MIERYDVIFAFPLWRDDDDELLLDIRLKQENPGSSHIAEAGGVTL
jgi:hypothetical protein